ncbi:MAG: hypothetical protein II875_07920 [Clostridia bacterium]|nr:hypothetical protein [Clostridia bacterium]
MSINEEFQSLSTEFIVVQILLILAVVMAMNYLNNKKTAYGVAGAISAAVAFFFRTPMEYACVVALGVVALCFIVRLTEDRNAQQSETTRALFCLRKSLDDVNKTLTALANKDRNITITAPSGFVYAQEMPPLAKQPQQYKAAAASAPAEPASVILKGKPEPELKDEVPEPIETPADVPAVEQELYTEAPVALAPAPVAAPAKLQVPAEEASAPEQTTATEQTETPVAPIQTETPVAPAHTESPVAAPAAPERIETPAAAPAVPKPTEPPVAWQPQPVAASQPPKEPPQQPGASAYPPSPQPVARPQPARPASVFRDEESVHSSPVFREDASKEEIVYRSDNKLAAFFKKRSVLLLIAFFLGIAAIVGYTAIFSDWISDATVGALGTLAAIAMTFPAYASFVGVFFALLGWLLNQRWAALLAGIAFGVAMLLALTRFYIPVLPMAFCIAAYSKMKKAKT